MAGAVRRPVTLRAPDWAIDPDALAAAITPRARVLLLNSPHNPTGKVLSRAELELIAAACVEHDLIAITDEVYEHLVYDGEHVPLATLPGMAERTLTISSLGKTFSVTGWKTGWAVGPARARGGHAHGQAVPDVRGRHAVPARRARSRSGSATRSTRALARELRVKRDHLCAGLEAAGLEVLRPAGTYFANVDCRPRRRGVLPRAGRARRRRRDPDERLLRRRGGRAARSCASRSASARASSTRRLGGWRCGRLSSAAAVLEHQHGACRRAAARARTPPARRAARPARSPTPPCDPRRAPRAGAARRSGRPPPSRRARRRCRARAGRPARARPSADRPALAVERARDRARLARPA